jgi:hypothetical protein
MYTIKHWKVNILNLYSTSEGTKFNSSEPGEKGLRTPPDAKDKQNRGANFQTTTTRGLPQESGNSCDMKSKLTLYFTLSLKLLQTINNNVGNVSFWRVPVSAVAMEEHCC